MTTIIQKEIIDSKIENFDRIIKESGNINGFFYNWYANKIFQKSTTTWNLTLEKKPTLITMLELLGSEHTNKISLLQLQTMMESILNKSITTVAKEQQLSEKEILEIIRQYLELLNISDGRSYTKIRELTFTKGNTTLHVENISILPKLSNKKETGKLKLYKEAPDGILFLDYNNSQLQTTHENSELLNGRFKSQKNLL